MLTETPGQFLLGDDLIVAPAFAAVGGPPIPASGGAGPFGTVGVALWVPPGDWRDFHAATPRDALPTGWMSYAADINTVPVLVRGGAAIAMLPRAAAANATRAPPPGAAFAFGASARQYSALTWRIFPGAPAGTSDVYEDDGLTTAYLTGASARTTLSYVVDALVTTLTIATSGRGYDGMVTSGRAYAVELLAAPVAPARVTQNGVALVEGGGDSAPGTWERTLDGATVVRLFLCATAAPQTVEVQY